MISSDIMNSRAYLFQLQAAEAAAAAAAAVVPPVVHAADDDALEEPPTPKSTLLLEIEAQAHGTPDASPALEQQGSRVVPMCVGGIAEPTKCPECPKWFVSEKAMFGHLRKHPDRGYKGATRPPTAAPTATALAGGETKMSKTKQQVPRNEAGVSTMNLMMAAAATAGEKKKKPSEEELSTKWPVTAKRGRAPFAPAEAAGKQKQASSEDEEAAMILLGIASSSHSTTSETQQQASVQQQQAAVLHAPDAASGHQFPDGAEQQQQPMLLDDHHVSMDNLTLIEAEQIVQPAGIVLELSAESQTPPAAVKEITSVEVTTESLHQVVTVPVTNKPVTVAPGSGSGGGAKKAKKQRRAGVVYLERRAAAFPAPPPEGADGGSSGASTVWRIPSPASNKRHVCPTCGKWFSTYQALGGHMSSHVKAKSGFAGVAHEELAAAQARHNNIVLAHRSLSGGGLVLTTAGAGAGTGAGAGVAGWVQGLRLQDVVHQPPALMGTQGAGALHVCAVCHMTFPSGQALGGHKRKHWFPEKHQTTTKAAAAPVAEQAAAERETAPTVRGFDLNEMPEEGEGESDQP